MVDLADYDWLTSPAAADLLDELAATVEPVHLQLNRLRKALSAERARLLVQQVELRRRAISKFGDLAARMFFTDVALQQATDLWTARYKANRLPRGSAIDDYCCGIGGDLLALAERGPTTGWDRAPEIALMANSNLRAMGAGAECRVVVDSVETQSPGQIWHLDPDRRNEGRRSTQMQWHSPGPELVERWLATNPHGMLKLAPATSVPDAWAERAELEWITHDRQCRQQVVWFGELASAVGKRRATVVPKSPADQPASFTGSPVVTAPQTESVNQYIYDTDPAIRASGLTGAIAIDQQLLALTTGAAYLTSDQAVAHPLLTRFEVLDELPLRTKALSKYLKSIGIGRLEIKKRGVTLDPEQLRKQLKLRGSKSATLLLTRLGAREIALLARRC